MRAENTHRFLQHITYGDIMMEANKHTMYLVGRAGVERKSRCLIINTTNDIPYFLCSSDVPGRQARASCMLDSCISCTRTLVGDVGSMLATPKSHDPTAARTNVSIREVAAAAEPQCNAAIESHTPGTP